MALKKAADLMIRVLLERQCLTASCPHTLSRKLSVCGIKVRFGRSVFRVPSVGKRPAAPLPSQKRRRPLARVGGFGLPRLVSRPGEGGGRETKRGEWAGDGLPVVAVLRCFAALL